MEGEYQIHRNFRSDNLHACPGNANQTGLPRQTKSSFRLVLVSRRNVREQAHSVVQSDLSCNLVGLVILVSAVGCRPTRFSILGEHYAQQLVDWRCQRDSCSGCRSVPGICLEALSVFPCSSTSHLEESSWNIS